MAKCEYCKNKVSSTDSFCGSCGKPTPKYTPKCEHCKTKVSITDSFCGRCGKPTSKYSLKCEHCKVNISTSDLFCGSCGKSTQKNITKCEYCKENVSSTDSHCGNCGKPLKEPMKESPFCENPHKTTTLNPQSEILLVGHKIEKDVVKALEKTESQTTNILRIDLLKVLKVILKDKTQKIYFHRIDLLTVLKAISNKKNNIRVKTVNETTDKTTEDLKIGDIVRLDLIKELKPISKVEVQSTDIDRRNLITVLKAILKDKNRTIDIHRIDLITILKSILNRKNQTTGTITVNTTDNLKIGDIVKFGQENSWVNYKVVKIDTEDGTMLVAEEIIKQMIFSKKNDNKWSNSDIRDYLNVEYFNSLNLSEQNALKEVSHNTIDSKYSLIYTHKDKIRLLSREELELLGTTRNSIRKYNSIPLSHWLITPYTAEFSYVLYVNPDGSVYFSDTCGFTLGVVPVLHLNNEILISGNGTEKEPYTIIEIYEKKLKCL